MFERHIEPGFVSEFERQHFLFAIGRCWNARQSSEASNAVFEMNHEIVFVQLAEIDLGAVTFRVVEAASCVRGEAAEQFGGGQNDKVRSRKTKPGRERAQNKIDIMQCVGADQFAKTLDLALGLKINDDARFIFLPFVQALNELVALRFRQ